MKNEITFGTDGWRGIIARDFTFDNGSIEGTGVFKTTSTTNGQNMSISRAWENTGTVNWSASAFWNDFELNATFTNSGTFKVNQTDAGADVFGSGTFNNQGTFTKTGALTTDINVALTNSSTISYDWSFFNHLVFTSIADSVSVCTHKHWSHENSVFNN